MNAGDRISYITKSKSTPLHLRGKRVMGTVREVSPEWYGNGREDILVVLPDYEDSGLLVTVSLKRSKVTKA